MRRIKVLSIITTCFDAISALFYLIFGLIVGLFGFLIPSDSNANSGVALLAFFAILVGIMGAFFVIVHVIAVIIGIRANIKSSRINKENKYAYYNSYFADSLYKLIVNGITCFLNLCVVISEYIGHNSKPNPLVVLTIVPIFVYIWQMVEVSLGTKKKQLM